MSQSFVIASPRTFGFRATVFSHGWLRLAPFAWDEKREALTYLWRNAAGEVMRLELRESEGGARASLPDVARIDAALQEEAAALTRRMLSMNWDLRPFYAAMRAHPEYGWLESESQGRILRAGSVWEDLAKTLLTTNTRWAQTVKMCARLCQLGEPHPSLPDQRAFPSAERIASMEYDEFSAALRAGYRNAYLRELAEAAASGALDLEAWRRLDSDGLAAAVKSLKGFGDYAAGTMARLLGHFDKLAIDSACRDMYARKHNGGMKGEDADIKRHYARYGKWQGLVMWLDIMNRG